MKRTDIKRVANRLAKVIYTTDSLVVLRCAAEELGRLNLGDESAITALEQLIQYSQPLSSRFKAISSLIAIAPQNPLTISALIEIVSSDLDLSDLYILRDTVWALKEIADIQVHEDIRSEAVIVATAELINRRRQRIELQSNKQQAYDQYDAFLCNQGAGLLGAVGVSNQIAIRTLLNLIRQTCVYQDEFYLSEHYFGWEAVEALGKIAIDNSVAITELSQMLSNAQEPLLRCHIAVALLRINRENSRAMSVLFEILEFAQIAQTEAKMLEFETLARSRLKNYQNICCGNRLAVLHAMIRTVKARSMF